MINKFDILLFRYKRLLRISYQLGILRALFVLGIIIISIAATYILISAGKNTYLIASFYLLLCLMIQLRRKDKNFLKINFSRFRTIYLIEYAVFSIPLILCLLLCKQWLTLLYVVAGILLISTVDCNTSIRRKVFNTNLQKLIPVDLYEWKAGVRRHLIILFIVYGLGVCFSWFVAAIPIAMVITGLIISDFFVTNESWQMLLSFGKNAKKMLLHKIKRHFFLYAIVNLPLVILFVLFHHERWYIPVIAFIALLSIHIYMITVKFAHYEMDGNNSISPILQLIGLFLGLIPVTVPVLLLLSVLFFQKACTNLKPVLHDFD